VKELIKKDNNIAGKTQRVGLHARTSGSTNDKELPKILPYECSEG
jgi:hypothetical protein